MKNKIAHFLQFLGLVFIFGFLLGMTVFSFSETICEDLYNDSVSEYVECIDYFESLNKTTYVTNNITRNVTENITTINNITNNISQDIDTSDFLTKDDLPEKESSSSVISDVEDILKLQQLFNQDRDEISTTDLMYLMMGIQRNNGTLSFQNQQEELDLSDYVKKEDISEFIKESDLDDYAKMSYVNREISSIEPQEEDELNFNFEIVVFIILIAGVLIFIYFKKNKEKEKKVSLNDINKKKEEGFFDD